MDVGANFIWDIRPRGDVATGRAWPLHRLRNSSSNSTGSSTQRSSRYRGNIYYLLLCHLIRTYRLDYRLYIKRGWLISSWN